MSSVPGPVARRLRRAVVRGVLLLAAFAAVVELAGDSLVIAVAGGVVLLNVLTVIVGASLKQRRPRRLPRIRFEMGLADRRR